MKKPMPAKPLESDKPALATFDLRDEPWIPVVREDGNQGELSLRAVLRDALHLREIRDQLPTVEFGLYRLLITLVLDIFELQNSTDLEALLGAGEFNPRRVDEYFEKWHDRFDLFHRDHPFLQTPGMDDVNPKPLAGLLPPIPSGTNASHFHHADERAFAVSPAAAARLLTTIGPFMTSGGAGLSPSINGAPPWYALIRGRTLFETLCLNCPVLSDLLPQAQGDEPPAWRNKRSVTSDRRNGASLLAALTWQPRRIQLLPDGPGSCALTARDTRVLVREMKFSAGFGADFEWTDPHVPYRIDNEDRRVLRPQEGRAVWRDTGPIALLRASEYQSENGKLRFERPPILTQFAYFHERKMVDTLVQLDLSLYGLRTDLKMKVFEWHRERLSLPALLLWKAQFHRVAQQEMDRADSVAYCLRQAIKRAYPREGAGNKDAFKTLITNAQHEFWTALRAEYSELLDSLALLSDGDVTDLGECVKRWRQAIRDVAKNTLDAAIEDLDTDADALERQTAALRSFANALFVLLEPEAAAKVREAKKKRTKKEVKR
jgi:CRISPR system Cascade subunit CasA